MTKGLFVNLGCGQRYHCDWKNFDFYSNSEFVSAHNLLEGIPLPDTSADVVYHSHVLEHFPRGSAHAFLKECHRVLKPGGIIRIAIPDLHGIAQNYMRLFNELEHDPLDEMRWADYDWIMLEMYDQTVRNYSGGAMAHYLRSGQVKNKDFVLQRCGEEVRPYFEGRLPTPCKRNLPPIRRLLSEIRHGNLREVLLRWLLGKEYQFLQLGRFRSQGEIHQWMYDRLSLGRMLANSGFIQTQVMTAFESNIPEWTSYELDGSDGKVRKPDSLFMEARKP
jgi:predicted SAM-dependent methyltransferase